MPRNSFVIYKTHLLGTGQIPGPITNLHVALVTNTTVTLKWLPYQETSVNINNSSGSDADVESLDYLVQYGKVNNMTMYETVVKLEHVKKRNMNI